MCQKTFLLKLSEHSDKVKMCSTSLAKYTFEKWRNAMPLLREDHDENILVKSLRSKVKAREFFGLWQQAYKQKRRLNCLYVYGSQTYSEIASENL